MSSDPGVNYILERVHDSDPADWYSDAYQMVPVLLIHIKKLEFRLAESEKEREKIEALVIDLAKRLRRCGLRIKQGWLLSSPSEKDVEFANGVLVENGITNVFD